MKVVEKQTDAEKQTDERSMNEHLKVSRSYQQWTEKSFFTKVNVPYPPAADLKIPAHQST